jgi:hypothetical protein
VVRAPEKVDQEWLDIGVHLGRLRPYHRMPFSRSVRAGFQQLFDVSIPDNAFFLARDDAPRPSGWTIGAVAFAGILVPRPFLPASTGTWSGSRQV